MPKAAEPRLTEPGSHKLTAVTATILVFWALKATTVVVLPFVFAIFLVAVFWPFQRWLSERVPKSLAVLVTVSSFLVLIALLAAAVWYGAKQLATAAPRYQATAQQLYGQVAGWLREAQVPVPSMNDGSTWRGVMETASRRLLGALTASLLVLAYFVLGLLEVRAYHLKVRRMFPDRVAGRVLAVTAEITGQFQRYMVIRTGLGLLNGICVWLGALALGLDLPFVWGLLTFVLNYIPTVGSVIATFPPVLFAFVQFEGPTRPLLTLLMTGGFQLLLGNYVDPLVEGRFLRMSPLVVLVSIAFWGWLWGIAGAFLSVPITAAIIIVCRQFERTEWLAALLSKVDRLDESATVA